MHGRDSDLLLDADASLYLLAAKLISAAAQQVSHSSPSACSHKYLQALPAPGAWK